VPLLIRTPRVCPRQRTNLTRADASTVAFNYDKIGQLKMANSSVNAGRSGVTRCGLFGQHLMQKPKSLLSVATMVILVCSAVATAQQSSTGTESPENPSTGALRVERLPVEDATQILQRLRKPALQQLYQPSIGDGTWRRVEITGDPGRVTTNIIFIWRRPDGQQLSRHEQISTYLNKPKTLHFLRVTNEEGGWAVHQRIAILYPKPPPQVKKVRDPNIVFERKWPLDLPEISGERIKIDGRIRLRFIEERGEKGRRSLDIQAKELKKNLVPLVFRPFIPNSILKQGIEHVFPARRETILDEGTGELIIFRAYALDGGLVWEQGPWEPCPDLPPDAYAAPQGVRQIRPKTADEANRLESETREEERKEIKP
jgi:hypothetical protein